MDCRPEGCASTPPSLPFDPASLCFTDSQERSYPMPTLGYSFGATQTGSWLRGGETYRVSVSGLANVPNQSYKVTFNDLIISSLVDEDRDGTYLGWATFQFGAGSNCQCR
ncbi:MAG: hypothetical protein R2867_44170 [Caldilineaceae bacterium]